jgi:hypothetical protein
MKEHYEWLGDQFVWNIGSNQWAQGSVDTTQELYKTEGKYVAYPNAIEERMAEVFVYEYLKERLPECTVLPHFYGRAPIDIQVLFPDGSSVWVDVKRKQELDWTYEQRYHGTRPIDQLAGISANDAMRTLRDVHFLVNVAVSDHLADTVASSGMVTAVVDTSLVNEEDLIVEGTGNNAWVRIPISHKSVQKGKKALDTLVTRLRKKLTDDKQRTP